MTRPPLTSRHLLRFAFVVALAAPACTKDGKAGPEQAPSASPSARPIVEAPDALGFAPDLRKHFQAMANAPSFGGLAIGAGGVPSDATEGFRAVLGSPRAAEAYAFAAERGSVAGQLYGLSGLAIVDRAKYEQLLPSFKRRDDVVDLWESGCTGGRPVKMRFIVEAPTAAQAQGPGDTISSWSSRNPGADFGADIVGGFFPIMLAGTANPAPKAPPSASASASASTAPSAAPSVVAPKPGASVR